MSSQQPRGVAGGDEWAALGIVAVGLSVLAVWGGAQVSAIAHAGRLLDVSPGAGLRALIALPSTAGEPALAWDVGQQALLPGPVLYWACTVAVSVVLVGVAVGLYGALTSTRIGTDRAARLGVEPSARLARRRDLRPLVVDGPAEGRFILGRVGRKLVATEDRHRQSPRVQRARARSRVGDRSAVVVVGPARCGKTANVTAGILDWNGPAILSSVKDDLYTETIGRRRQLGEVFVFDPFGELPEDLGPGVQRVGWSPLAASTSISGAQQAANTLLDAGPTEGVTNANYWSTKGEQLLWPMLHAAAVGGRSMGDIARWLALQDGLDDDGGGEVVAILTHVIREGGMAGMEARQALTAFAGFWKLDPRTRSDIFSTAQTLVTAWEDPYIAAASATRVVTSTGEIVRPTMDLRRLLEGNNTLYVVQPLKSVERFAVVFGGLLGDLLRDQAYEVSKRAGGPIPATLAVVDEAGNTPLRWLPQVASTCAGIGVQLVTVWQSLAQIKSIYQAQMDALLTNHGSKIFFSGLSDGTTLRYVSELGGEEEVTQRSATADTHWQGRRRSMAASTTRTRLLPADLLRQVPPGSALLLHGTLPPAHLVGRRPWEERRLARLARGECPAPKAVPLDPSLLQALEADVRVPDYVRAHMDQLSTSLAMPGSDDAQTVDDGDESRQLPATVASPRPSHPPEPDRLVTSVSSVDELEALRAHRATRSGQRPGPELA